MGRTGATRGIKTWVLEYMTKRPGEHVYLDDMSAAASEQGKTFTKRQIQTSIANSINTPAFAGVSIIVRGNCWVYRPQDAKDKRLFEEVGVSKDGRVVIQDADGNLFIATEI